MTSASDDFDYRTRGTSIKSAMKVRDPEKKTGNEQLSDQTRWDREGQRFSEELAADPDRFRGAKTLHAEMPWYPDLMRCVGPLPTTSILEIGCGRGEFAVHVAKQGAVVTAIDVGEHLIDAARQLAKINGVECDFVQASATDLPFDDAQFDIVIGLGVLHHMSEEDVSKTMRQTHRVLKPGGRAYFGEPIENSRTFDFIQNFLPAGKKGDSDYRPSILQRREWAEYEQHRDQRALTDRALVSAGSNFRRVTIVRHYGFFVRLWRLLGKRSRKPLIRLDAVVLRVFPPLRYLSRSALVEYEK
jgi:2-polyprenyl-3-methyl-5-hydroxy-6-metoxy-1,4-benzoquinol methylase